MARQFPTRGVLRRPALRPVDVVVGLGALALLYALIRLGSSMNASFVPKSATTKVSTDPADLPYYAARSLLRMFIALFFSVVFTFVYGSAAARLRRAETVLIPALDILQSVPILGFLSITVTGFIALFPGSLLGLECAAIFAIFTSQAWNMAFSFYHSLVSQPRELDEAARLFRLTKWQRFWKLDVPQSMIGLVWNGMMSFGGGWFFLVAAESISVLNQKYALPGIGSYVAAASADGDLAPVLLAIVVMVAMVLGVNFFFWRPLVAWSEKFRNETTESADRPRSIVYDALRRSGLPRGLGRELHPVGRLLERATRPFGLAEHPLHTDVRHRRVGDIVFAVVVGGLAAWGAFLGVRYISDTVGFGAVPHVVVLGCYTFLRVVVIVIISSLIWVPIGVKIGMSPRVARSAQPLVQVLASFPATFIFPFVVAVFVATGTSLNLGGIVLMAMGAQWYVLFNTIAGASAIPSDLREAMDDFDVTGWQRWRKFILPAVFPYYVTGGITAAGGAWNAAIIAEIITYNHRTLIASGLGAYIAQATATGNFPEVLLGVSVMSLFVVLVNRLFWRRLYHLAETKYSL
jgi:NitT/TauT family transport system permease protein